MENNSIADNREYNARMKRSMLDKVFFLDKVFGVSTFIDFGCADGTLLKFMRQYVDQNTNLVGYDYDKAMIEAAKKDSEGILFISDFEDKSYHAISRTSAQRDCSALILSSVIHEVYHYMSPKDIDAFWKQALTSGFKYVIIRDMCVSRNIDRPSDVNDVAAIYEKFLNRVELRDFESNYGSIENNRALIHFLLKYKYTSPNWTREVKENYFALYREDLLALLCKHNYEIVYHEHYVLPYIRQTVKDDFGIEIKDPTHIKIILKLK